MSDLTRADLTAALETQSTVFKRDLNDRFEHYEKRQDERHREMLQGFAEVIENVNGHMDERLDRLEQFLKVKERIDRIEVVLAEQFGRDVLTRAGL